MDYNKENFSMSKTPRLVSIILFLALLLSACNLPASTQEPEGAGAVLTAAAQTVEASLTQSAQQNTPTVPVIPTSTLAIPTFTLAVSTNTQPAATNTSTCDLAQFIKDVTIPDGTGFQPNETFTKTWQLKNIGTCNWSGYSLVFDSGEAMSGPASTPIGTVAPGQEVNLSVNLKAPSSNGTYRGYWRIKNSAGVLIPVQGGYQSKSFYIEIKVAITSSGFDLHSQAPAAEWKSGAGNLTFGGPDTDANGFVMYRNGATLEDGSTNSKVLEMHPQWVDNGVITGLYPPYTVVTGEHFKATIGFLGPCGVGDVKFQLNYREAGTLYSLDAWTDTCDGVLKSVDVDLSSIAGKNVRFALAVLANGTSAQDWAVWIRPRVEIP